MVETLKKSRLITSAASCCVILCFVCLCLCNAAEEDSCSTPCTNITVLAPAGPPGPKGAMGPRGLRGRWGIHQQADRSKSRPGPAGEKGARGARGKKGDPGAAGSPGVKGQKGEPGSAGAKGERGQPGMPCTEGSNCNTVSDTVPGASFVAFSATLRVRILNAPENTIVTFDIVHTNVGNAYNKTTGKFAPQVSGYYMLTYTGMTTSVVGSAYWSRLKKNGEEIVSLYDRSNGDHISSCNSAILQLQPGDEVWVELDGRSSMWSDPGGYVSFSGFLIHPD
ncbi:complement C1q-like protein 3 [Branchiostoma floridae]|uniref:Complement C1q-like protein 3 n=1 Tax=Branchiostoma floridae TaxID=7739 RepID=A0A9J7N8I7_BRAFL|nr:complement C1q-like protein 3 [Branchiostoma floridae]